MKNMQGYILLAGIIIIFCLRSLVFAATIPSAVLISEVAMKEDNDWIELIATANRDLIGVQVIEGVQSVIKVFSNLTVVPGDIIVVHLNDSGGIDESNATGKGGNNYWDVYSTDTGLVGTDNVIRLEDNGVVVDAVVWSNADGTFSSSKDVLIQLNTFGIWSQVGCVECGWQDSDTIKLGQSLERVSTSEHSVADWIIAQPFTPGLQNHLFFDQPLIEPTIVISPTEPIVPTITIEPSIINKPTVEPLPSVITVTPAPTITPTVSLAQIKISDPVSSIEIGKDFHIRGIIENLSKGIQVQIKAEATSDLVHWYEGQTKSESGEYVSWNGAWANLPMLTNDMGDLPFSITARIKPENLPGDYSIRIKIKLVNSTSTYTSDVIHVAATRSVEDEIESDEAIETDEYYIEDELGVQTIEKVKNLTLGDVASVEGIITSPTGVFGQGIAYIEDSSGGIKILFKNKDQSFSLNEVIRVQGEIRMSLGEHYLYASEDPEYSTEQISLLPINIQEYADEKNIGRLISTTGTVTKLSGNTFWLKSGKGNEVKIYIKDSTGFKRPMIKKNDSLAVLGILSKYKDEVRILPRSSDDIKVSGQVKGLATDRDRITSLLPKTGSWVIIDGLLLMISGVIIFILWKFNVVLRRIVQYFVSSGRLLVDRFLRDLES
ncbi:hypothetical protein HGA91_00870 [candidate division WWE3 bacterium]|nr:hypothetical protein [candidate division WWE3 bacterium]